ncbi:MAG: peptidoglycan-binding domain-containing protein [Candidatus Omnitrophota bacterium]
MGRVTRLTMLMLMVGLIAFSGCASRKTGKKVDTLQAQVNAMTDELVRLDQSLEDTRAALQTQESGGVSGSSAMVSSGEGAMIGGMYRTPSGFEIPSVNIQKALKKAGYYSGAIDGKVGPGTRDAITSFQKDNGLTADGICGRGTWSKLKSYLEAIK